MRWETFTYIHVIFLTPRIYNPYFKNHPNIIFFVYEPMNLAPGALNFSQKIY